MEYIRVSESRNPEAEEGILKPEWLRIPETLRVFGISRAKLYDLIAKGRIKSVSLRERGQTKGTRLINYESIQNFLEVLSSK